MTTISLSVLSDVDLLAAAVRAASEERRATSELLAILAEVDTRRLYLAEGCSSMFSYCTRVLHLSEHAAYHRIEAARAAKQFPVVLDLLAGGELTLTTVAMLRPHLTLHNHAALLSAARHQSKREVEHQIACLAPKPDVVAMIRRVPEIKHALNPDLLAERTEPSSEHVLNQTSSAPPTHSPTTPIVPRAMVAPLASDRYLLRVTLSADAHAKLRRAQDLLRHSNPDGNVAEVLRRALTMLVDRLETMRTGTNARPRIPAKASRTRNRYIPAHVKREVWTRDGGRCAFIGTQGRCSETGRLEFHHLVPYARGGATDVANISLRCRAHNSFESERLFGPWVRPDSLDATRSGPS